VGCGGRLGMRRCVARGFGGGGKGVMHGRMNYKDTELYMSAFFFKLTC
jgi:hypothetical protein